MPLWRRSLASLRSAVAFLLVLLWFVPGSLFQRLFVWPAGLLVPRRRQRWVSAYFKGMSAGILAILRLGGARSQRPHRVPTSEPVLLLMNHQSLLDVPVAGLVCAPYVPRFVARKRYGRFIPAVSLCLRALGCPLIDPRDRTQALSMLRQAAREQPHGLLLFPEGHRTTDGALQPFRTAGAELILRERPVPVYLVVTDGFWTCRRLVDFVFNVHRIQGRTEVLGPFPPPGPDEVAAFLEEMRLRMQEHLARTREHGRG